MTRRLIHHQIIIRIIYAKSRAASSFLTNMLVASCWRRRKADSAFTRRTPPLVPPHIPLLAACIAGYARSSSKQKLIHHAPSPYLVPGTEKQLNGQQSAPSPHASSTPRQQSAQQLANLHTNMAWPLLPSQTRTHAASLQFAAFLSLRCD